MRLLGVWVRVRLASHKRSLTVPVFKAGHPVLLHAVCVLYGVLRLGFFPLLLG